MVFKKRCSKCKQILPAVEKYFNKRSDAEDGLRNSCRLCQKIYMKKYQQIHKEKIFQQTKRYNKTLRGYLHNVWHDMLRRCENPKHKSYKYYGGRGIKIKFACWRDFYDYVVNVLKVEPRGLTIDRINNNGHYERGNIRFVTQAVNNENQRIKMKP